ncbi:MAG: translocation/assembly module TamB domain-containing protein [Thermodesulfobacteriota bacterium]
MRHAKIIMLTLALFLGLERVGNCSILPDVTNWGGASLLTLIQGKVNGKVSAGEISGNPISGITYRNFQITGGDGKTFLAADRLDVRLSLSSIASFRLNLANLTLTKPRIYLSREKSGQWNVSQLIKEVPKPAKPEGLADKIIATFLRAIDLSNLEMQQGEVQITKNGEVKTFTNLDLKSSVTLLQWGQPQQQAKVNLRSLGVTMPQGRAELETRLAYSHGLAQIDSLNLKLAGQTVVSLRGEICRPLSKLTCTLTGTIGPLPGEGIHGFWSRWPALWDLSGAFSLTSTPQGGKIDVKGKIGQSDYTVRGDLNSLVEPGVFHLDLDLKGLTTAQLQAIKDLKTSEIQGLSPVNARLRLEGRGLPWKPESLTTRLALEPFQYRDLKVDKLEMDLSGNARRQNLQASLAGNFGSLDLKAGGHLLPLGEVTGLSGDLTVQTKDLQPARVGVAKLKGTSLTGLFTGKFRVPPSLSLAQVYLAGKLDGRGSIDNRPLQGLSASFILEGRKLTVSQANLQMAGIAASLKGTLTESGVDVTFDAAVSGSRTLPLPSVPSFASLKAQGAVRGTWKAPQISLAGQVHKLSPNKNLNLELAKLNATLSGWPPQTGNVQLVGSQLNTPAGTFSCLNLNASGAGGQWQFQAAATSPKEPKFEMAGTADLTARPLVFRVSQVSWRSQGLKVKNQTPFQVHILPGWEISPVTFLMDGGTVTLAGLARDQELSGHLEVRQLNAGLLAPLGLPAEGKLNGRLTLAGNPRSPSINGQISLNDGKVQNFPLRTLTTTLAYQDNQAQISGYLEIGPQQARLVWKGSVPVQLSLLPFKFALAEDGLDLRLHSERANLSQLTAVSKEVQAAEGLLEAMVEARGNPRQPRVSGYVRWKAGYLQLRQAGTPYRLVPGEIRLQGDKIVIPGLILENDGTVSLSGEIDLAGPLLVKTRLQAENFRLLDRGGNEMWTNGAVDLNGPLSALMAKGRLTVPKARLRPTLFRTGQDPDVIILPLKPGPKGPVAAPGLYRNMRIDVIIEAPGNVFLMDPMGKVELTANLKAVKNPDQKLVLGGDIRALSGTLDIEEKPFKVERAILTLPGVAGRPILVDVKAIHEMEDITLVLTVMGTMANPKIRLESEPPLPPADVLSYLVFGGPAATLSKEQYLALGVQQLGVLGGVTTNKLSEILGSTIPLLSGIKVKSGMLGGRPTVGLGKEVAKNVNIFVGRNFNEERGTYENQVGLEYKFNKNWSVESQIGSRNSGADVFFNYDF